MDHSAAPHKAVLDVAGIDVGYGRRLVLSDFSIAVGEGETFGLMGLNGAGKTTLIKAILGLRDIRKGAIAIGGRESTGAQSRRMLAYLPERFDPPSFLGLSELETRVLLSTTEDLRLVAAGAGAGDQYGQSINVDGDFMIVGAPARDGAAVNGGAAFIYQRNGSSWTQVATLTANDATNNDFFGTAVAISGDRAVVGELERAH